MCQCITNLNETNRSRGMEPNNMGHGARSLQAKWKHNIDPGEMEEEGVGALLAVRLHTFLNASRRGRRCLHAALRRMRASSPRTRV